MADEFWDIVSAFFKTDPVGARITGIVNQALVLFRTGTTIVSGNNLAFAASAFSTPISVDIGELSLSDNVVAGGEVASEIEKYSPKTNYSSPQK